jgi:hypothetical protein
VAEFLRSSSLQATRFTLISLLELLQALSCTMLFKAALAFASLAVALSADAAVKASGPNMILSADGTITVRRVCNDRCDLSSET